MVFQDRIRRPTRGHRDMIDLTEVLASVIARAGIRTGIAHLSIIGSTAALGAIEFEPGLCDDLPEMLDRLIPPNPDYGHERAWHDGNGHSHLQATLLGQSMSLPVTEGRPALGTWQQIFLLECDIRPRQREVVLTVLGE